MKTVTLFFLCCLLTFGQQEQKIETKKPAVEQVKQEPVKKSARDPNNDRQYTHAEWCAVNMYYFLNPQLYVAAAKKTYGLEISETEVMAKSLRRMVIGGCVW